MGNIKSMLIGLMLAITIMLTAIIAISVIYEDELSQYLVEELNEYILSEIDVEDINFSLLKKFPKASLELKNVVAFSKTGYLKNMNGFNTDTLFFAKSIYVQLNLIDIISKNYTINKVHFDQGQINLFVDRFGDPNYVFWDTSIKKKKEDFNFELKEVKVTESEVLYYNEATNILAEADINKIDFKGNFSRKNYLMKIKSNVFVKNLAVNTISYIENKDIKTNLNLDIINDVIQFNNGLVSLQNLKFELNGTIDRSGKRKLDLLISGKGLGLNSVINNLPYSIRNEFPSISGQKGKITLNLSIAGENMISSRPHIRAMFIVNNAQLYDKNREIQLKNMHIDGEFDNGNKNKAETSKITFKAFQVEIENNWFKGAFELRNLTDPLINLSFEAELYFEELKNIFEVDTLDIFNGHALAQLTYKGRYNDLKSFKLPHLFTKDFSVNLIVDNAEIKLKDKAYTVSDISGNFDLNRSLFADSLSFRIGENDFLIHGRVSKLFEYLNDRDIFNVNAKLYSRKVNLNELAHLFRVDNMEQSNSSYEFPDKFALQLQLNIQNFEVGKFNATNISGNLNYKPKMFSLHEISFNSMNGSIKAGGVIIQKFNKNFLVKTQSRLDKININNLFYSFNNFGQSFITNKNLDGNLTGDIYFTSEWSDKIKIFNETVTSDCDILISEGELNDFDPMNGLSRFIDVEELKNIKFSSLKNRISIENEKISIPQMDIESSVLNLKASGEHNFNTSYSYHTELLLSDLLSGKVKKSKPKASIEKIEEDTEGRITLYLLIEGSKDGHKVKYDKKAARTTRKSKLKEESEGLKRILNEEYGWFKNDTSISKPSNQESKFQIEFEESKKKIDKVNKKAGPGERFIIEWEEDTAKNE